MHNPWYPIPVVFEASGGNTLFDSSPPQRFHRDAHAAAHHIGLA